MSRSNVTSAMIPFLLASPVRCGGRKTGHLANPLKCPFFHARAHRELILVLRLREFNFKYDRLAVRDKRPLLAGQSSEQRQFHSLH
jgi:hypothetical protein